MDAIAKTAYYCCGARSADAASAKPICGDHLAQRFMNAEARLVFARFSDLAYPNACNVTRARIIDDWLRERLKADRDLRIVLIGAGFDTRAYRLQGGEWFAFDQPSLLAAKNAALPLAEAANPLKRVAIDFASEELGEKLAPFVSERPAVVVMEGVSMYLSQEGLRSTLATLRKFFPRHMLMCDLMTKRFSERYGSAIRQRIASLGGSFAELADAPARSVLEAGYRQTACVSIVGRARELGAIKMPRLLLDTFFRSMRDGYCACQFEAA